MELPDSTKMTADTFGTLWDDIMEIPDDITIRRNGRDRTFTELMDLLHAAHFLGKN